MQAPPLDNHIPNLNETRGQLIHLTEHRTISNRWKHPCSSPSPSPCSSPPPPSPVVLPATGRLPANLICLCLDPATARGASPVVRSGDLRIGLLLSKEGQPVVARWQRAQASPTLASRHCLLYLGMHPAMGVPWDSCWCAHGEIQVRPQAGRHR